MHRIIGVLIICALPVAAAAQDGMLDDLTIIRDDVRSRRVSSYNEAGANRDRLESIETGERRTIFDVDGPGIINHIWITIAPPPDGLSRNDIILRMYWDGSSEPCVEAPIGPFFGQGWEEDYEFISLPLAVAPRGGRSLVSYFKMPFEEGARIEIENEADGPIAAFYFYVDYVEVDELPDGAGRFHAHYRHELTEAMEGSPLSPSDTLEGLSHNLREEENSAAEANYVIADLAGNGHFVGVNYYVHSPTAVWYGEGDDMFFIDGERWPPELHGTGTEDYFNTAWVPKSEYRHPFFGIARANDDVGWLGRTHLYRFHITDPIHFDESLHASIEHGHNNNLTLDLASVAYWYQHDPHKAFEPLPEKAERAPKRLIGPRDIHRWRQEYRRQSGGDPFLWGGND